MNVISISMEIMKMTDGMIQKVFKEAISLRKYTLSGNPITPKLEKEIILLESIQKELISEIKKLFPDSPFRHSNAFIISRLIGDNE